MYTTVNESDFHDAFEKIRPNNFSYAGRRALFNYLSDLEEDTGTPIELDVIALCCAYTEGLNKNHLANYGLDSIEDLSDNTIIIYVDDETSIIQDY